MTEQTAPNDARWCIDRAGDRWDRVAVGIDLWRYDNEAAPPRSTADLIEYRSPIRWYAADGTEIRAGGKCGESVPQALYDVPPNAGSAS